MGTKRTRTGCLCCRRRHKKCDEQKPSCKFCLSKGIPCEWPMKGAVFVNYQSNENSTSNSTIDSNFNEAIFAGHKPSLTQTTTYGRRSSTKSTDGGFNPNYSLNSFTVSPSPTPTLSLTKHHHQQQQQQQQQQREEGSLNSFQINTAISYASRASDPSSKRHDSHSPKSSVLSFPHTTITSNFDKQSQPQQTGLFSVNYTFNNISPTNSISSDSSITNALESHQQQTQTRDERNNYLPPLKNLHGLIQPVQISGDSTNSDPLRTTSMSYGYPTALAKEYNNGGASTLILTTDGRSAGSVSCSGFGSIEVGNFNSNGGKRFSVDSLLN